MLESLSTQPRPHQSRGWRAQNHLPVEFGMVGMRVTDKDPLRSGLRFMGVEPKAQFREENAPIKKSKFQRRHKENCGGPLRVSTSRVGCGAVEGGPFHPALRLP